MKIKISFYVSGRVETEVDVPNNLTIQEIEQGLNGDGFATTLFPDGSFIDMRDGKFETVGKVEDCPVADLEYTFFEVESIPLTKEEQEAEDYKTQKRISD